MFGSWKWGWWQQKLAALAVKAGAILPNPNRVESEIMSSFDVNFID
jgi:hypothetical protein